MTEQEMFMLEKLANLEVRLMVLEKIEADRKQLMFNVDKAMQAAIDKFESLVTIEMKKRKEVKQ